MKNRALNNAIALILAPPDTNSLAEALDLCHGASTPIFESSDPH